MTLNDSFLSAIVYEFLVSDYSIRYLVSDYSIKYTWRPRLSGRRSSTGLTELFRRRG